jgi:hypothetical protein
MFLSDGWVDEVDLDSGHITRVGQIWEPIAPQYWASAKVWRAKFWGQTNGGEGQDGGVLFGSPKGLYAWSNPNLYSPGDPAPDWLTDIEETAPEEPVPPMPEGLPGIYAMEVYHERLFVAGKNVISFSAPSNGANFSTTSGGGSFGYFGDKLTYSYMDLAASAGYLFVFGDSSIDTISNIQLTGSGTPEAPFTTLFNYTNHDPQVGHRFPRVVGRVGRYFTMYNGAGIFELSGAYATQVGEKVTNIYNTLDTSLYLPTMCTATMFGFRVLLCNGRFTDPWGVTRNLLLMWHPGERSHFWSVASQNLELTHIGHYEQDSIITPYGTDGTSLYQLFAQPDPALLKILSTKALRGQGERTQLTIKNFKRLFCAVHDNSGLGVSFTGKVRTHGGVAGGVEDIGFQLPRGRRYDIIPQPLSGAGISAAVDLYSKSPDFVLERLHIAAEERTLFGA